jgi:ABC-type branched-subunit amino acid transport system ATPase component
MKQSGSAVLIVEHNLPIVFELVDDVTVLDRGAVLFRGTPEATAADPQVARIYAGGGNVAAHGRTQRIATAESSGAVLDIAGLAAGYGGMRVVHDFDLQVRQDELVAIVGRNGTGKTTALAAIGGVLYGSNGGTVTIGGTHLEGLSPWQRAEAGIALVPEGRRIFRQMSVADNLVLASRSRRRRLDDLDWIFALVPNLERYLRTTAGSLSGGEQQMVAVAQALVARPRFVLLDEPTAGLAPIIVDELFSTLLQLRSAGIGVLVVDQNVDRLVTISDRAYLMDGGRLVLGGPSHELSITEIADYIVRGADRTRAALTPSE